MLSDYFHTFQIIDIVVLGFFVFIFDQIGFSLTTRLSVPSFLRPFYWVVGMALFSCIFWISQPIVHFDATRIIILTVLVWLTVKKKSGAESLFRVVHRSWPIWL